jgi:anti-sigma regulatory factor (Ser/Thr protein kinase)
VDERFDAGTLHRLRAAVAAHASDLGLTRPDVERIIIVAGELATNAVRHGGGRGRLRLWRDQMLLGCQVNDHGPGIPDCTIGATRPDPMAASGFGMWICRRLSDNLIVTADPSGSTVTAVFRFDDHDMDHRGATTL